MIMSAIYAYLIFSLCCGGILGVLLWMDQRAERLAALKESNESAINSGKQTPAESLNNAATDQRAVVPDSSYVESKAA